MKWESSTFVVACTRKTSRAITGLKDGDAPARNGFAATVVSVFATRRPTVACRPTRVSRNPIMLTDRPNWRREMTLLLFGGEATGAFGSDALGTIPAARRRTWPRRMYLFDVCAIPHTMYNTNNTSISREHAHTHKYRDRGRESSKSHARIYDVRDHSISESFPESNSERSSVSSGQKKKEHRHYALHLSLSLIVIVDAYPNERNTERKAMSSPPTVMYSPSAPSVRCPSDEKVTLKVRITAAMTVRINCVLLTTRARRTCTHTFDRKAQDHYQ